MLVAFLLVACMGVSMVKNSQGETAGADKDQADPAILAEAAQLGQTITPPPGWTFRQDVVRYRPMALFYKPEAERDGNGKKIFNENVNIIRDNLLSKEEEYLAKAKGLSQRELENYESLSERRVNLSDGTAATLIELSFVQNGLTVRSVQLYAAKGNKIYILTSVILAKNWDDEKEMVTAAVMSFKFPE